MIRSTIKKIWWDWYIKKYVPRKVIDIRKKQLISVVFVVTEPAIWKTELLYKAMLKHPRFQPIILLTRSLEYKESYDDTISFLKQREYPFLTISESRTIDSVLHPDIILWQKPYEDVVPINHSALRNLKSVYIYALYGVSVALADWNCNRFINRMSWHFYVENKFAYDKVKSITKNHGSNLRITGVPMMDELLIPKSELTDFWKPQQVTKKRIIWSPHHSIDTQLLSLSTFMRYYDFMLLMAQKYKDKVQFAFKPHPLLKSKLYEVWGVDRTNEYYNKWATMENTQYENSKYLELFKYSDAMIHDCCSFILEYHYSQNPVMFLTKDGKNYDSLMYDFSKKAFDLCYKGSDERDIEAFINSVMNGEDSLKGERELFYNKYLLPPNGKSACQNIIDDILG
jgi:hypothetical protein